MMTSAIVDEEEWPTLTEAKHDNEDWEMLRQECPTSPNTDHTSFEIVVDDEEQEEELEQKPASKPKEIRHCVSSPNLSSMTASFAVLNSLDAVAEDESDAFSLISGPASVMTASTGMMVSFRDAMLASSPVRLSAAETARCCGPTTSNQQRQRSRKIQPRFVVVASPPSMRRGSKSTGDLQSLAAAALMDEDEEVGDGGACCDTMEFHHRKALGSASRSNGLKLRPDEAKRRAMIMHKKELQRQQQATTKSNITATTK
jgi:hypothetical protein